MGVSETVVGVRGSILEQRKPAVHILSNNLLNREYRIE